MLNLICDMYKKVKCRVKWKGKIGEEINSEFGVLQGGLLSPKLYTEFLTDLRSFQKIKCRILIDVTFWHIFFMQMIKFYVQKVRWVCKN